MWFIECYKNVLCFLFEKLQPAYHSAFVLCTKHSTTGLVSVNAAGILAGFMPPGLFPSFLVPVFSLQISSPSVQTFRVKHRHLKSTHSGLSRLALMTPNYTEIVFKFKTIAVKPMAHSSHHG